MTNFSIEKNEKTILFPNSLYERRVILQYYLDNDIKINEKEKVILENCVAVEPESIGIIGCLLEDDSYLNTLRLAVGSKNKSNYKLAEKSLVILNKSNIEKADLFYMMKDDLTAIEQQVSQVYDMIYFSET